MPMHYTAIGAPATADGGALASSARNRYDEDGAYRPPGLSEWVAASKPITSVQEE